MVYKNLDQLCKISLKILLRDVKLKYNTIQYNTIQITWITWFARKIAAIDKLEYIDGMYQTESMLAS
jgi:hypothetical protein